ncbi:MAG: efflux RND transporter permease subunit, partial [Victivallales bacterium]|nr:efflux RND transporter permease subunit [Victivallales bacterium]
ALKISPEEVAQAIREQNIQAAVGAVGTEHSNDYVQYKINTEGRLKTEDEFSRIVVRSAEGGRQITLGDISRVELGASQYSDSSFFNGESCVALAIYRNDDANALQVIDAAKARLEELSEFFPEGLSYTVAYDPTNFVRATMREIVFTLCLTLVLVVLITYVFLQDWRATLIPSVTIPVSLVGSFVCLYLLGFSANVLTLFALILAIGSVVDDAIVVVENVIRLIEEEGLSPSDAAHKAMRQVTGAIISTTLVLVAVFAPIGFIGGMVGVIYRQFAVAMCAALIISTINALTLSPALCAVLLRPHKPPRGPFKVFNRLLSYSSRTHLFLSGMIVRRGIITLLLISITLGANYFFFRFSPTEFLPQEDKGVLFCALQLPPGATLKRTDSAVLKTTGMAKSVPGVRDVIGISGFSMIGGKGENMAMVIIILDDWSKRKAPHLQIEAIRGALFGVFSTVPEAQINVFTPPAIMGLGVTGGVSAMLQATGDQSPQELAFATKGLLGALNMMPESMFAFSTYEAETPQINLDLDRAKCVALKVPVSRVFSTLQGKLASYYVNDFNLFGYAFKVKIQSDAQFRSTVAALDSINIVNDDGDLVPLNTVARASFISGPRQITRFNQAMSADLTAAAFPGVSSGKLMDAMGEKIRDTLPKDYRLAWTGMSYQERQNVGKIAMIMAFSILFGYLFLVGQYESWSIPCSVLISVSVAVLGALAVLFVMRMPLSIYAQLGLIMLVALSSKNAILVVEFSKQLRESGMSIEEAAMQGARTRYRAVLMTAYSFILGVVPMVFATGAGAGSRRAIGITTFSGMLAATLLGIVFVPALYALFQRTRERAHAFVARFKHQG